MSNHLDWIDTLPDEWQVKPLRAVADSMVSNVDKLVSDDEPPVRLCNYTDVYHNEFITPDLDLMHATASAQEIERFGVSVGDVLVTKDSESWDDIGVPALVVETADDIVCGYHLALLRPRKNTIHGAFLFRCLQARPVQVQLELAANGVTRFGLPKSGIRDACVPVPPLPQQRAIADHLDREIARLDALIAEKERLLKLLTEKRQALITRAVTRGLDPDASMRDSGIPWLGEIPAHWNLVPLRFLVSFVGGATPDTGKEKYWSGDIPWVSPKDMKHGEIDDSEDHVTELAVSDTSLRMIPPGSVLVVVRGMILAHSFPAAITKAAVTVNQDMKALLCRERLDQWFLRDFFKGIEYHLTTLADSSAHGTRKLETERLGQIPIPLPSLVEQQQITRYILDSTNRIDKTRTTTERMIALLKERRAALIVSAVTGQIDVEYEK